jgi:hypothetical protein
MRDVKQFQRQASVAVGVHLQVESSVIGRESKRGRGFICSVLDVYRFYCRFHGNQMMIAAVISPQNGSSKQQRLVCCG